MVDTKLNMKKKEALISNLVMKFDEYMVAYKEKRKVQQIFNEFDQKTRKDFISLV